MDYSRYAVFDIETNGLLPDLDRVHLLTIKLGHAPNVQVFRHNAEENTILEGLNLLVALAEMGFLLVGHNIIKYDIPAIQKVYPFFALPWQQVFDTMVFARLKFADLQPLDAKLRAKGVLPKGFFGMHSLEAWGTRLGQLKGEYEGDTRIADEETRKAQKWAAWNPDMETYGIQDAVVTEALFLKLNPAAYAQEAVQLEHDVARILARQERFGVCFNEEKAAVLYGELAERSTLLERELRETVPGAFWPDGKVFVPKRDNKGSGYVAGAEVQKVKFKDFNPGSREHVARYFKLRYGWQPEKFSETGEPTIDDEVLSKLDYPEAPKLAEYYLVQKRIGQIATGKESWLKHVRNGRIHGSVNPNGAVTGRMTHSYPNMNVPKVGTKYGKECRELFGPPPGMDQVGCDASGLELRNFGHFVARYDGGEYARAVVEGKESEGTDIHSLTAKALGLEPQKVYVILGKSTKGRNCAKTFKYAFLYGGGDEKIGRIVGKSANEGRKLKATFLRKMPGIKRLKEAVAEKVKESKSLRGLDGRILHVRSAHAALNTLLQSAGAIVMKRALVILDAQLQADGLVPGVDYEFMLNVHDEFQIATKPEHSHHVGRTAVASIRLAGESFGFRCPLDGEYKVGRNWAETH